MAAVLWMAGTLLSFCLMAISARQLSQDLSTFQVLFFRSLIGLVVIYGVIRHKQRPELFQTRRSLLHIGRNLFHFGGQYGWFWGISLLPLAEVFALEFTVPIWTIFIAAIALNERLTPRKLMATMMGLTGVYIILTPGTAVIDRGAFIVLAAALCYAVSHVATKALTLTENPLTVLFYMCWMQLPVGLLLSLKGWVTPQPIDWLWLITVGLTALTAHFCLTHAMHTADVGIVVTLDFLRLPLIALVDVFLYEEDLSLALFAGASLMLLGNWVNLQRPTQPGLRP